MHGLMPSADYKSGGDSMNKLLCIGLVLLLIPFGSAFECADKDRIANAEPGYGLSYAVQFTPWYLANCNTPVLSSNSFSNHNGISGGTATKYAWRTIDEDVVGDRVCVKQYFVRYNSYTGAETHYENRLRTFCIPFDKYNPDGRWNKEKYGVFV